jgi:hypothetical protein
VAAAVPGHHPPHAEVIRLHAVLGAEVGGGEARTARRSWLSRRRAGCSGSAPRRGSGTGRRPAPRATGPRCRGGAALASLPSAAAGGDSRSSCGYDRRRLPEGSTETREQALLQGAQPLAGDAQNGGRRPLGVTSHEPLLVNGAQLLRQGPQERLRHLQRGRVPVARADGRRLGRHRQPMSQPSQVGGDLTTDAPGTIDDDVVGDTVDIRAKGPDAVVLPPRQRAEQADEHLLDQIGDLRGISAARAVAHPRLDALGELLVDVGELLAISLL